MSVKVNIHKTHRRHTDGMDIVEVRGDTVGACLQELIKKHPDIKDDLFDKKGDLLNIIEIYIDSESAYPDELKKPVKDGDEIYITIMLAGG